MAHMSATITDDAERQRQGWKAIHERTQRSLVFILGGFELEPTGDPFAQVCKHPEGQDHIDVAFAVLKPELANLCRKDAITLDEIAADDFVLELPQKEPVMLCGFPRDRRVQHFDHEKRVKFQGYVPWAYTTSVRRLDSRGRYEMVWDEGVAQDDENGLLRVYGFKPGEVFKQGHPQGVSGGPLWLIRGVKKSALWVAERAALLIGINESWDKEDTELCPSTSMWGPWFRSMLADSDAQLANP
jgi:hypothetical protein